MSLSLARTIKITVGCTGRQKSLNLATFVGMSAPSPLTNGNSRHVDVPIPLCLAALALFASPPSCPWSWRPLLRHGAARTSCPSARRGTFRLEGAQLGAVVGEARRSQSRVRGSRLHDVLSIVHHLQQPQVRFRFDECDEHAAKALLLDLGIVVVHVQVAFVNLSAHGLARNRSCCLSHFSANEFPLVFAFVDALVDGLDARANLDFSRDATFATLRRILLWASLIFFLSALRAASLPFAASTARSFAPSRMPALVAMRMRSRSFHGIAREGHHH